MASCLKVPAPFLSMAQFYSKTIGKENSWPDSPIILGGSVFESPVPIWLSQFRSPASDVVQVVAHS